VEQERDQGVGIVAVHGMPGVGKTAFAVRAAHAFSERFPDGQLFADLRAHRAGAEPMTPAEALPMLLRSLGVAGPALPSTFEGQIRKYRTVLSDRRVLILLDDAFDAEQVRALVPGGKGCMLIVTSRHRLDGILALDGAHAFHLDVLTAAESHEILVSLLGEGDSAAYREMAQLCGHLPLALRVAAANVALEPRVPLAESLAELAGDPMSGLRMPADGQVAPQAAFAQSYRRLSGDASILLRRMGDAPCVRFTVDGAAALLGAQRHVALRALEELTTRCLVDKHPGRRYGMHELIRRYAGALAGEEDPVAVRRAALDRLLGHYLRTAEAAARVLYPERLRLPTSIVDDESPSLRSQGEALEMLDAELEDITAVLAHAAPQPAVWCLADALRGYFVLRLRLPDWLLVAEAGLRAAQAHGDLRAQGAMRHSLGVARSHQGDHRAAVEHLAQALELYRAVQWAAGCAAVLVCLGDIFFVVGRLDEASAALEEALEIAAAHDMPALETAALGDLGEVYRDRGLLHRAHDLQLRTARRCLELGMSRGHAIALVYLGLVCLDLGDPGSAQQHLTEAGERLAALGSLDGEAFAAIGLTAAGMALSRPDHEALARIDRALALAESLSDYSLIVEASLVRTELLRRLGRAEEAAGEALRARDVASKQDYQRGLARAFVAAATVQLDAGDLDGARASCLRAFNLSNSHGYALTAANAMTLLAEADHGAGEHMAAVQRANLALELHRQTGHRPGEARTARLLKRLAGIGPRRLVGGVLPPGAGRKPLFR
jgi:tetratricopeptide (TPR) repeat protein